MNDEKLVGILRISDEPSTLYAADRIEKLSKALGFMLESYGAAIGEIGCVKTPLSPKAIKDLRNLFAKAGWCNEVFHAG